MGLAPTPAPGVGGVATGAATAATAVAPATGGPGGTAAATASAAINIQTIAGQKNQEVTIAVDPVKDILVFPHQNNRTYRSGYVMLMAFASDYSLKDIAGTVDSTLEEKQKNTKAKKRAQTFNGDASAYLANARANNRRFRKIPGTKLAFTAILPMPLGIGETTSIDWNSAPSGFNQQIVGAAYQAGSSWATYLKSGGTVAEGLQGYLDAGKDLVNKTVESIASVAPGVGAGINAAGRFFGEAVDATVLGTNVLSGAVLGDNSMHNAALNSVAGSMVTRPSKKMMQLQGPLMDYAREAAAINGRRQIINDPGYWQNFQGVTPRSFTLRWTVIPENHEDAMNGLALCARIKEFSLPESVSEVELLSPHYWQIQFSNPLVQSQLLYNNLVIKTINVTFMENGEIHLSGTPKKFDIEITFEEAKSPTAEVYKVYDETLRLQGGKLRNSPSVATASIPKLGGSGGSGGGLGGSLGSVFSGKFGGLGSNPLGGLADLGSKGLGKIAGIAGGAIGGLSGAIGNNLGGAVGGVFGNYAGNLVADTVSNAINSAGSVLTNAIATGDFSNLGDKMKDAALAGATSTVIGAASEIVGEYASKVTDYAMETLGGALDGVTDWLEGAVGAISPEEEKARGTARTKAKEAKEQQEKVKELKKKLEEVEKSQTLTKEQKDQARKKVEEEYRKARKLADEAEKAKKDAESYRKKAEEVKKAEEAKKAQEKANKTGGKALEEILGNS